MQSAKGKMSDVAAAAKSGTEKTEAPIQEKVEKMTTRVPLKKDTATARKEVRKYEAELEKQAAYDGNATGREAREASRTTTGHGTGYGTATGSSY